MKLFASTAITFLALTAFAYAADDPFGNLYANTLVYTMPNKVVMKVLVQKDGTWTQTSSDGTKGAGTWATVGNFVCISDQAMATQKPDCSEIKQHNVGDTWTVPGMAAGTTLQVTLTAGR